MKSGNSPKINIRHRELRKLGKKAKQLALEAQAPATRKAYKSDMDIFTAWANDHNLEPLPAAPETIVLYLTHLYDLGRASSTIVRVVTAIAQAHRGAAFPSRPSPTTDPRVGEVLKGIQRKQGTAQRQARPLIITELKKVIDTIQPDMIGTRDKALLLVGWASALRRSELMALNVGDLEFCDKGLIITIRRSKTDQTGKSEKLGLPEVDSAYCPVKAVRKWIELARIKRGAVFVRVGTQGQDKWFVPLEKPARLSTRSVSYLIKRRVKAAGLKPDRYSGHSLRAGFITSAAEIGTPEHLIMDHTRHRSAKVLRGYIRTGQLFNNSPLPVLL